MKWKKYITLKDLLGSKKKPHLIDSDSWAFHKDSEYGPNSKITKNTTPSGRFSRPLRALKIDLTLPPGLTEICHQIGNLWLGNKADFFTSTATDFSAYKQRFTQLCSNNVSEWLSVRCYSWSIDKVISRAENLGRGSYVPSQQQTPVQVSYSTSFYIRSFVTLVM